MRVGKAFSGSKKQIMKRQSFADCELWLQRGTLGYMAPELMGYKHDEDESNSRHPVTMAVDIYSFGLLLWAIITGEKPRIHDESLRKPRHASSQVWRLPNIALCWAFMHLAWNEMQQSLLDVRHPGSDLLLRASPWERSLR